MAEYVTTADALVALGGTIPFSSVSIPCNTGNVVPLATGVLNLRGSNTGRFARYNVRVQANVQIPTGGAVTPIALGIALNGAVIPESVAIVTPAAVGDYWHINTEVPVTIPCGCCGTVSAVYVDGTEDDAATTPTPSIQVRRNASITVERTA
ncbi:MAG: hypothetical protein J6S60_00610 [Oscillospiraceae bacterium]|nr:hypothetical protein [Oscillospiraceae bacterium]